MATPIETSPLIRTSTLEELWHLPEPDCRGPGTLLEPDLFYMTQEAWARSKGIPSTTADLVIEVLSPGSQIDGRTTKADTYAALGVRELWLVDGERKEVELRYIDANSRDSERVGVAGADLLPSRVLPAIRITPEAIFAE